MEKRKSILLAASLAGLLAGPAAAVTIHFDYSYDGGFFSGSNLSRRTTLDAAGQYFSAVLQDSLAAIDSNGGNQFTAIFSRPDTGATGNLAAFDVAADTLTVFVGGRDLGGNALGLGGPGGYSVTGTQSFLNQAAYRGETGAQTNPPSDFATWGGSISFDADAAWYFDSDPATTESFSGFDFYSVALHELGHVLGFGTANSWSRWLQGGKFTGLEAKLANAGQDVLLSADAAHWQSGQTSTVNGQGSYQAAMTPNIAAGTRKNFTDLDLAALSDIGWEVAAAEPARQVPLPEPAYWLLAAGLAAIGQRVLGRGRAELPG
ncbi:matrixin family metalloprotease [Methylomonas sp. DH-1]|uniref:matrixin family metalloprotease n=1 Tax=Methylomonas sp. (strain DH-1) TaxID=1727196 RepID=UPI0007C951DD|nr:matrixin family metalloprotease [Methylomonas sp. DH-1]ANE54988.1 hypothetical protein AYM39_07210 [Methylomonas sp. DH-1]